jgi:hypothetical protein
MRHRSHTPSARAFRERQSAMYARAINRDPEPKLEYLTIYKGRSVIVTDHVKDRANERHGMPISQMKVYFHTIIDGLDDHNFKPVEYNQEIFVYSKTYQRGCIVAFRRDFKSNSQDLIMAVVTMYPYGKSTPAHPDTEVYYV